MSRGKFRKKNFQDFCVALKCQKNKKSSRARSTFFAIHSKAFYFLVKSRRKTTQKNAREFPLRSRCQTGNISEYHNQPFNPFLRSFRRGLGNYVNVKYFISFPLESSDRAWSFSQNLLITMPSHCDWNSWKVCNSFPLGSFASSIRKRSDITTTAREYFKLLFNRKSCFGSRWYKLDSRAVSIGRHCIIYNF